MLTVSRKIKHTVIAKDFPVEVDGRVAEHNSHYSVQVHRSSVVNVQKRKIGQAIFSHRCAHAVIQSSQCAVASFAFVRCDRNCAGNLEKNANIWKKGSITATGYLLNTASCIKSLYSPSRF